MVSPLFILCSALLLSGVLVEPRPDYKSFDVINKLGSYVSETVSNVKDSINNLESLINDLDDTEYDTEDNENDSNTAVDEVPQNTVNGLESITNTTKNAIDDLTPTEGESVAVAVKTVLSEVGKDVIFGENLYKSMVQRTIEVTSKMESKVAQAIEAILLRVQMLQNGDSFADVVAEVSRTIRDHYHVEFD